MNEIEELIYKYKNYFSNKLFKLTTSITIDDLIKVCNYLQNNNIINILNKNKDKTLSNIFIINNYLIVYEKNKGTIKNLNGYLTIEINKKIFLIPKEIFSELHIEKKNK